MLQNKPMTKLLKQVDGDSTMAVSRALEKMAISNYPLAFP